MTRIALLFGMLGLLLCSTSAIAQETTELEPNEYAEYRVLFNGVNLDGWDGDPRLWSVKDGVIHGKTTKENAAKGNTSLIVQTDDKDGNVNDFELRLSFRCNATNNSRDSVDAWQWRAQEVAIQLCTGPIFYKEQQLSTILVTPRFWFFNVFSGKGATADWSKMADGDRAQRTPPVLSGVLYRL